MQCSEFRRLAGADPQHLSTDAEAHCAQCAACTSYLQQMQQLDGLLKRALEVPAPSVRSIVTPLLRKPAADRTQTKRWFALAASILLAVVLGAAVWLASPRQSLAADVIVHIQEEPDAMVQTDERVASAALADVLHRAGVRLKSGAQTVSIARYCPFRGTTIPHLVVQTPEGPITVLVLPHEHVKSAQSFNEQGYRGTILPSGRGAIAIVATSSAAIDAAAAQIAAEVEWIQ
jgi:anti-sigma factor RsiW